MTRTLPLILTISLIVTLVGQGNAQDKPVLDTSPPPPAPRLEATIIKALGNAKVRYTEAKNESAASSDRIMLPGSESLWGHLYSYYIFNGKIVTKPENVFISFFIAAKDRSYIDDRKFIIYDDNKMLVEGIAELIDGRTNGIEVYSRLRISLPLRDFAKVAQANKLKIKIGPTVFEMPDRKAAGFEDLLTIIEEAP